MFRVVTVAREYGSGGGLIAQRVAEELQWNLLDQSLIRDVARAAQVDRETVARYDERVDPWWRRFIHAAVRAAYIEAGASPLDSQFFDEKVAALVRRVIASAAVRGNCVIVGRGAECVLQDRVDVLHVFIYGPWNERVSRIRTRAYSLQGVEELIDSVDCERASYMRAYYGCDWKDPHLYHMMISSQMGIEAAVRMIVNAVRNSVCDNSDSSSAYGELKPCPAVLVGKC